MVGRLILSGQRLSVGSAWDYFSQSRAIITINDPDMRVEPDTRMLASVFGLTPSEAKVAAAFYRFEGDTAAVAHDTGLAYLSVKSYLKSIFAKMGVQSQTQMLLLISRLFERSPQFGG